MSSSISYAVFCVQVSPCSSGLVFRILVNSTEAIFYQSVSIAKNIFVAVVGLHVVGNQLCGLGIQYVRVYLIHLVNYRMVVLS